GFVSGRVIGGLMPGALAPNPTISESGGAASVMSGLFGSKSDADRRRVADAMQTLATMGRQAQNAENAQRASGGNTDAVAPKTADASNALAAIATIATGGSKIK